MKRQHLRWVIAAALVLIVGNAWGTTQYTVADLGTFGGSYLYSMPLDINNSGQVVGSSWTEGYGDQHAFLYGGGTMHDLGTLGGHYSGASAINNRGAVVGPAPVAGNVYHAFLYDGVQMRDLGTLGSDPIEETYANDINDDEVIAGQFWQAGEGKGFSSFRYDGQYHELPELSVGYSTAHGINSAGVVVGESMNADSYYRAYRNDSQGTHDLGTLPGYMNSSANAINDSGVIVGNAQDWNFHYRGFVYANGTMTDLGTLPGFTDSFAVDINSAGQIVGAASPFGQYNTYRAYVAENGQMSDLNALTTNLGDWTLLVAEGINDNGQIVGFGMNSQADGAFGHFRGFLLTPIPAPEPSTLILAAVGVVGLLACAWRKR
jgi:probable HAF family extracellular repeat protein